MGSSALWVGTMGQGLWWSDDGDRWVQERAVPADAAIFSLASVGDRLLAGGRGVLYRRTGDRWETLALPDRGMEPWTLAVEPHEAETVLAGCRPLALLRSEDGGAHWSPLALRLRAGTPRPHTPRVTAVLESRGVLWCGVEVGGVFTSEDGGKHWIAVQEGLPSLDIHALAAAGDRGERGAVLLAATPRGIARLENGRWRAAPLQAPWAYCRALVARHGWPGQFLCGLGDGPPGTRGAVVVGTDGGSAWHAARFPGAAGSTVWSIATAGDGSRCLAAAIRGELYASEDQGASWERIGGTFDEVRAVLIS